MTPKFDDRFLRDPETLKFPVLDRVEVECDIQAKEFLIVKGEQAIKLKLEDVPTAISLLAEALRQWGERRT